MNTAMKKMKKVAEDVYCLTIPTPFPVGPINLYIIISKFITLVDTGPNTEECWEYLGQGMQELNLSIEDIDYILITHQHPDHLGLVKKIKEKSNSKILGHPLTKPFVEKDPDFMKKYYDFFRKFYRENGVPENLITLNIQSSKKSYGYYTEASTIDNFLHHMAPVPNMEEWIVYYTPGHAQSHISIFRDRDGVLIGGDFLLAHASTNPLIEPIFVDIEKQNPTVIQFQNSLAMSLNLGVKILLPGHGEMVAEFEELVIKRMKRNWVKATRLYSFLEEDGLSAYQLAKQLHPERSDKELLNIMSDTVGHLELLVFNNIVRVKESQDCLMYLRM